MEIKDYKKLLLNKSKMNLLILSLAILVYLLLFFKPKIRECVRSLSEASRLKEEVISIEKAYANIAALEKEVQFSNAKIDYYEKRLPVEKEIPAVLEYLASAAKKLNVRITEIRPVQQDKKDEILAPSLYYKVPILLKAECGYHQLGRFLNEIEKAHRFMKISGMAIAADARSKHIHNVQLTIVTYVMKK